ncbi:hypothetical protein PRUPE_3G021800 [Prunus persica]|uniref:Leucine-rich repeat-containing N-terminal plant-type domain-containing protein n=1 Tax=Prunus persica TaxID=3760 RepID=A0A251PTY5_PRUPE|nr:hypothetical protein PRUPE_3G021800 [Prunus persica]
MRIVSVFRFLSIATITTISLCNRNLGVPCKQNERQALLLMFKQDLKDPSNRLLSWVGEGDCCNWTGVVCDNLTGRVHEYLNYSLYQENSLGGKVNTSLPNLKHLSYLDLSNNDFGGIQIPSFLGSLRRLPQWLYTCSNLESLSIGNLTAIVNLDLSANQLGGKIPNSLGNLCKLTVLGLSRNYFNGRVSEILGSLSRCPLSDQLGNFRHLRLLALMSNSISGPIPVSLGNLLFLEEASISENHFDGTLPKTTGQLKMVTVSYVKSIAVRL